jgi:hypothetical protein
MQNKLPRDDFSKSLFELMAGIGEAQNAFVQLEKAERERRERHAAK